MSKKRSKKKKKNDGPKVTVDCRGISCAIDEGWHYHEYVDGTVKVIFPDGTKKEYYLQCEMQNDPSPKFDELVTDVIKVLNLEPAANLLDVLPTFGVEACPILDDQTVEGVIWEKLADAVTGEQKIVLTLPSCIKPD